MNNTFLDLIPEPQRSQIKLSIAVAGYRAEIAAKGPLLKSLFDIVPVAKDKAETLSHELAPMLDSMESTRRLFNEQPNKVKIYEMGANRNLYTDAAAAIILLADAAIDRLYQNVGISLFERGAETYAPGIHIGRAVASLANQYKHLEEWRRAPSVTSRDREVVKMLVGDPLRLDAAAEFLARGFPEYGAFESALISCADDIVTDGTIPARGRAGVPTITMRPADEE